MAAYLLELRQSAAMFFRKCLSNAETEIRMTEYGMACLVCSLAGHDKGNYYIIVREVHTMCIWQTDAQTPAKPKRKKRKARAVLPQMGEALAAQFADGAAVPG